MRESGKYEGLNPLERLHEGEPWFFIRAQDRFSVAAVRGYAEGLYAAALDRADHGEADLAAHLHEQAQEVLALVVHMYEWQEANQDLVKIPD